MTDLNNHINELADHLFRREAGKMVSVLTKHFGTANLQLAEDVVQDTLIQAMNSWVLKGIPDNPSAWLFRVAKNKAIDILRRAKHSVAFDFSTGMLPSADLNGLDNHELERFGEESPVQDDMLRMMFACCHHGISAENQVTLILKTLCGFSVGEIARAFLTGEETIAKRLYRSKEFFREHPVLLAIPEEQELAARIEPVLSAIYLLFNEGYNSSSPEILIKREVMEEAILLCGLITENSRTRVPAAFALMALMTFHMARIEGRLTLEGEIVLLDRQDRRTWNHSLIKQGNELMNRAATGEILSRYHLEAAIAFEHCVAINYQSTDWKKIIMYYDWLAELSPSPIILLNRAVAILKTSGAHQALHAIGQIPVKKKLEQYYLYYAVLGEIHSRLDLVKEAADYFHQAIQLTRSEAERRLLHVKLEQLSGRL